ncbi:MAG TPA: glycosyltransferase family 39 protein [Thermoleophilaceae bacterium]|nr:glycosyltransferase family 39 protein [Thermoleophilaceae bacterium]
MGAPSRRPLWAALAAVTVAALALRLPYLGNQSLWYDETFTRYIAMAPSLDSLWFRVKLTEGTPPLYYLVTWAWAKAFGAGSDASLRATAGIAGAACAPVAFLALRRFVGDWPAIAAAAIVAVSPMLGWYALDARSYSLLVLLALLSLWALSLLLEGPTPRRWAAWALAAAAALWTHYFAAFLVAAEVAVLLWWMREARLRVLAWSAVVALLAAPLLSVLSAQSDARTDHIGSLPLGERLEQAVRQLAMGPNPPRAWLEAIGLVLLGAGVVGGVVVAVRREARARPLVAIAAIAVAVPLVLSITDVEDRLLARNLLVVFPCLAGLAGLALTRLRAVPLAAYLAVAVATIVWVEADWRYQNPDWRAAAEALPRRAAGAPVVAFPALERPVAGIYLRRRPAGGTVTAQTVWLVVEPAREDRRDLAPVPVEPVVPPDFARVSTRSVHGFRLIELRNPNGPARFVREAFGRDVLGEPPTLMIPLR